MKRRIEKKVEKRRRDKIHELLDLTLDINSTMPREQEKTGNKPTAFLEFMGHIGAVELKVFRKGWFAGDYAPERIESHTYRNHELDEALCQARYLKMQLCRK
ncbi:hypothetical protein [Sellimonas intestinalis]|uniref:hypothetical protein n=1 Tax=Sellimonas intestinalis TaxID=1653434 RepID=UPI002941F79D|nr:hypothetical protein [Sellimonas intestinalis]